MIKKLHPTNTDEYYDKFIQAVSQKVSLINLKKSLIFFEDAFGEYILHILRSRLQYDLMVKMKWFQLLNYLMMGKYINSNCQNYVLNFNYTYMDKQEINDFLHSKNLQTIKFILITHVHGIASDDRCRCIMGVDDTTVPHMFQEFSKSYQIISDKCYCLEHNDDLFFNKPIMLEEGNKKINIFFYGHSLAKNDWSYFFALFDKYHLFDQQYTCLCFLYPSDNANCNSSKYCDYRKIHDLIYEYGIIKKSEGISKNLFTRLIMENRIKIIFF